MAEVRTVSGRGMLVVSTCGTSLLNKVAGRDAEEFLRRTANANHLEEGDAAKLQEIVRSCDRRLAEATIEESIALSAELNGIVHLYDGSLGQASGDLHLLLATDTVQGRATASLVEGWLRGRKVSVAEVGRFSSLQTADAQGLTEALADVVKWCDETLPGYSESGYRVVFNLTGGFKSTSGFMQALGMFYADEIVYIFESSKSLLRIPRLPVRIDAAEIVETWLGPMRKMRLGFKVSAADVQGLPETLVSVVDGEAALSPWGDLVWLRGCADAYRRRVFLPPEPLIAGDRFRSDVESMKLTEDQRLMLNKRLDDLSLAVRKRSNPSALDFKALKTDARAPSTHECDIWSDSSRRLFGHFDGERYVLDTIGRHL